MIAIISAFIFSAFLYKRGFFSELLEACRINDKPRRRRTRKARRRHKTTPRPQAPAPKEEPTEAPIIQTATIEDRKKLETICANILTARGYKGDAWGMVRKMTNRELTDIINNGY